MSVNLNKLFKSNFFCNLLHTFELKQGKVVTEPHIPLQNVWQDPLLNPQGRRRSQLDLKTNETDTQHPLQ